MNSISVKSSKNLPSPDNWVSFISQPLNDEMPKKWITNKLKKGKGIIEISDNGYGIPVNKRKEIFDRFTQIDNKKTGKPTGSGLGLFISKTIIEHHNGEIRIKSEAKKGTTFCIEIPLL